MEQRIMTVRVAWHSTEWWSQPLMLANGDSIRIVQPSDSTRAIIVGIEDWKPRAAGVPRGTTVEFFEIIPWRQA